jgi:ribosomal protein S18 acetylase RimI-like enzyme
MVKPAQGFSIRTATAAEATALARSRAALFGELDQGSSPVTSDFEAACRAAFEACFAADACVAWIAETPGELEPVGTLVLLKFPRLPTPKNRANIEGYILNVFVAPPWRHRGIATALVRSAIDYSRRCGLARIRLHATVSGRAVYAGLGFGARDDEMELDLAGRDAS